MNRSEFIKHHSYSIVSATIGTDLMPSVFMAQAILESNSGNSKLAQDHNNLFGIKAGSSWTGKTVNMNTGEYLNGQYVNVNDRFRSYRFAWDSIQDRVKFLKDRFPAVLKSTDPTKQAFALQDGGYATDPNYANKLLSIINENNLIQLDKRKIQMKKIQITMAVLLMVITLLRLYTLLK